MQNSPMTELQDAGTATMVVQFLKNAPWFPWLQSDTDTANKTASAIAAVIVAAKTAFVDPTTGILFYHTLTPENIQNFVFIAVRSMALQWAIYKSAVRVSIPPVVKSDPLKTDEEKRDDHGATAVQTDPRT